MFFINRCIAISVSVKIELLLNFNILSYSSLKVNSFKLITFITSQNSTNDIIKVIIITVIILIYKINST